MNVFQEKLQQHHSQVFTVDALLHRSRTALQDVLVFENRLFGRVLALDDVVQLTERDHHIYHELIVHVPLMAHGSARRVLIVGGGDGGALREVLKHPVEKAVLVEIDGDVIEIAKRFFPDVSCGAFEDPRARIIIGDGLDYVATTDETFDVMIVDSTDPIGPGEKLFSAQFYERCRHLLRPGGILTLQSGASFYQSEQLDGVCSRVASSFAAVRPFLAPVPAYPGGMLALIAAGQSRRTLCPAARLLKARHAALRAGTRYYTPDVHRAAFTLPPRFAPAAAREAPAGPARPWGDGPHGRLN
ncbi:MAG: polyamine aminopropyltransferase [Rhodospirillaceae bacterium]|nr:polyamine aminopropyltransferase [Rhodospirillaceae bacterium]